VFVSPVKPDADLQAWNIAVWLFPASFYRDGATGSLRFLENPNYAFALLLDPGKTATPGHTVFWCCPRFLDDEGSHE
jgi:hypothetical protein